jgi:ABC-type Mn2+/Zn2+ transport system permease subunit
MIAWSLIVGISSSLVSLIGALILDLPPAALTAVVQAFIFILATIFYNQRSV